MATILLERLAFRPSALSMAFHSSSVRSFHSTCAPFMVTDSSTAPCLEYRLRRYEFCCADHSAPFRPAASLRSRSALISTKERITGGFSLLSFGASCTLRVCHVWPSSLRRNGGLSHSAFEVMSVPPPHAGSTARTGPSLV